MNRSEGLSENPAGLRSFWQAMTVQNGSDFADGTFVIFGPAMTVVFFRRVSLFQKPR
jgi:hypothetical protein